MDRRKFLKAGMLGGIASTLPVSNVQATEAVEPIPGALGMLYDSTLCVGCQAFLVHQEWAQPFPLPAHLIQAK